jgi:hypothetical protein
MVTTRITLTAKQLKEAVAGELLAMLESVSEDGILTDVEVAQLRVWLRKATAEDIPAFTFLRSVVEEALADGVVTDDERKTIVQAILRIMPLEQRTSAKMRFDKVETERIEELRKKWKAEQDSIPASESQRQYLRSLGVRMPLNCSKQKASELLDEVLNGSCSVSNRQMMVLRFWNKIEEAEKGRASVSAWMDSWYAEDPDRLSAWTIWKEENGDCGRQDQPDRVLVGAGYEYIRRVKGSSTGKQNGDAQSSESQPAPAISDEEFPTLSEAEKGAKLRQYWADHPTPSEAGGTKPSVEIVLKVLLVVGLIVFLVFLFSTQLR